MSKAKATTKPKTEPTTQDLMKALKPFDETYRLWRKAIANGTIEKPRPDDVVLSHTENGRTVQIYFRDFHNAALARAGKPMKESFDQPPELDPAGATLRAQEAGAKAAAKAMQLGD